jgi:hypothetical protein
MCLLYDFRIQSFYTDALALNLRIGHITIGLVNMTIKCVKLQCLECGVTANCQLFLRKDGTIRYSRFRHYVGLSKDSKPQFTYHVVKDLKTLETLLNAEGHNLGHVNNKQTEIYVDKNSNIPSLKSKTKGLFVQSGKTSPSRGEDHRFKSGTAHSQIWYYVGFSSVVGLRFCCRSFCI